MIKTNELVEFIKSMYNSEECGYTWERSEGNGYDQFMDGYDCGYSNALYKVAEFLGIQNDLEVPEEPEEIW